MKKPAIIAANAFGMGSGSAVVRCVIHCNMSRCMENDSREADRAECMLFYFRRMCGSTGSFRKKKMPPCNVFTDKTLANMYMCVKKPKKRAELPDVSGAGKAKHKEYGNRFSECLHKKVDIYRFSIYYIVNLYIENLHKEERHGN